MARIEYSEVRRGMVIVGDDGQLYYVIDRDLKTPGNLPSKLKLKMKNIKSGLVNELRVHPEDKVEQAYLEMRQMQYLYKDGGDYVFMDTETYDQVTLSGEMIGDMMPYLKEETKVQVTSYEEKPLSLELPPMVELKVIETDPALKGATVNALYKPAVLETGLKITVPPFVSVGEVIQVDTRDGKYLGRVR